MLRLRISGNSTRTATVIGNWNIVDFGTGPDCPHTAFSVLNAPQTGDVGLGQESLCFDELHGKPPYNTGGPLFIRKLILPFSVQGQGTYRSIAGFPPHGGGTRPPDHIGCEWRAVYSGGFVYNNVDDHVVPGETISKPDDYDGFSNPNDLGSLGSRAYNRLRPRVEKVNLMQSLLEMRELPRMLKTSASGFSTLYRSVGGDISGWKQAPKGASDQFLNGAFGWRPFIQDIRGVGDAVANARDYFEQASKNNNRWMQRKFHEDVIQTEQVVSHVTNANTNFCTPLMSVQLPNPWIVPGSGQRTITRQRLTRVWYKGAFKYYRPEFDKGMESGYPALDKARKMAALLGLEISPTTLYKVTPWTWLIDWFVNVGDNVQRFEDMATGRVASKYFYLMRETIDQYLIKVSWSLLDGSHVSCEWTRGVTVKRRVGSDDSFSFSLLPRELSGMQLAILAALGISRA